ncbi:hypothetical protein ACWDNI_06045 [Nocardia niigatensis]
MPQQIPVGAVELLIFLGAFWHTSGVRTTPVIPRLARAVSRWRAILTLRQSTATVTTGPT